MRLRFDMAAAHRPIFAVPGSLVVTCRTGLIPGSLGTGERLTATAIRDWAAGHR